MCGTTWTFSVLWGGPTSTFPRVFRAERVVVEEVVSVIDCGDDGDEEEAEEEEEETHEHRHRGPGRKGRRRGRCRSSST